MPQVQEFTQLITNDGTVYNLSDGTGRIRWLMTQEGWGLPPVTYITHRHPQSGSERVADYRLQPRSVSMMLRQNFAGRAEYWTGRSQLLDVVRFNQGSNGESVPVTLRRRLADGSLRDLSAYIVSGPAFTPQGSTVWDQWGFTELLRFIAYNPVVTDPTLVETSFSLGSLSDLVFPITFSITFGLSLIDDTQNVTYLGTWQEYPTIVLTGPMTHPIITNNTTGEVIELVYKIPAGRVVTIDLSYGVKSVTDDLGNNLIGTLTPDSDLGTWHLAPAPEATGGINEIRGQASQSIPGTTEITIQHYNRYIGI